jgi:DNA-binding PadR family transcriptional regulator
MVEKEIQQEKEQRERLAAERYAINIKEFINENFLYLPANKESSSYKLLKALQSSGYSEFEKKSGVTRKNMAHMNEERRRRLNLPPLTSIDYNCIERAAQKLKLVIDCLMLSRRMSGDALIPKDIQLTQMIKHQERRHVRHQRNALKPNRIALLIYQQWGEHIQKEPEFNPEAVQVKESL